MVFLIIKKLLCRCEISHKKIGCCPPRPPTARHSLFSVWCFRESLQICGGSKCKVRWAALCWVFKPVLGDYLNLWRSIGSSSWSILEWEECWLEFFGKYSDPKNHPSQLFPKTLKNWWFSWKNWQWPSGFMVGYLIFSKNWKP